MGANLDEAKSASNFEDLSDPDDQDGGLYIITDICHTITPKSTFTRCNLSRDSIGRKPVSR